MISYEILPLLSRCQEKAGGESGLRRVAREVESLFLEHLLKNMGRSLSGDSAFGKGGPASIKEQIVYSEVAKYISEAGGIGLADLLYESLTEGGAGTGKISYVSESALYPWVRSKYGKTAETVLTGAVENGDYLLRPCKGWISSPFGFRKDPITGRRAFHTGIDIAAPAGTPVLASMDGRIVFSGRMRGYGRIVVVEHAGNVRTRYAHNKKNLVKEGDMVKRGEKIALVGRSGRATGDHLHFEIEENGRKMDPLSYMR